MIICMITTFHAYLHLWLWQPASLRRETTNDKDRLAVAIILNDTVVGHMPYTLAPLVSYFLMRAVNKGVVEITGENHQPCMVLIIWDWKFPAYLQVIDRLEKMLGDDAAPQRLRAKTTQASY